MLKKTLEAEKQGNKKRYGKGNLEGAAALSPGQIPTEENLRDFTVIARDNRYGGNEVRDTTWEPRKNK